MGNTFMNAAAKSKRQQTSIERAKAATDVEGVVTINVRIPRALHRKAQLHRIETGENMTQLINRLMTDELG